LLPSGRVLVAGGVDKGINALASAELYDPAAGTWTLTGSLTTPRVFHTATLVSSGRVLVSGGADAGAGSVPPGETLASAELYDPVTGTWSATGSLATGRENHTATLLPSGNVLVAGGYHIGPPVAECLASAELYDPVDGTWSATGSLLTARELHTATLLPSGRVLVSGGNAFNTLGSAELYDPVNGTWSATGSLAAIRQNHTATLLPSGGVLVAGGMDTLYNTLASTELYDPLTGMWTAAGSLATGRADHTATLLLSGGVLVAGGTSNTSGIIASVEQYDGVAISPQIVFLAPRASQAFTASGGSGSSYTWGLTTNLSGATLTSDGVYIAGATGGVTDVVRVTDSLGDFAWATVTVQSSGSGCGATDSNASPFLALAILPLLIWRRRHKANAA